MPHDKFNPAVHFMGKKDLKLISLSSDDVSDRPDGNLVSIEGLFVMNCPMMSYCASPDTIFCDLSKF